ncbi:MAG TPA: thiamine phosphate synthase [Vitreimonas sp.]|uniref:thiamine phosphate synthase n=1 Tax=Vitreimonas sp. TaxID=3069702 RepID=UPI002D478D67|nr:thiamine phosphate synthase [Vitreimonas sp.]HYD89553.1 thiamine phosphate synthase [Vitreimonas sp.]
MSSVHALAAQAQRLNRDAGGPAIPALFFFTDPKRTPDPCAIARRLPRATAIVYRHFGAAERAQTAGKLASIARARGLLLLIAADPELAQRVGADGVHWPERLTAARVGRLMTVSAHGAEGLARAEAAGADACVLAPIFPTRSASGRPPLGLFRASQLARAARTPVIALGGVNADTARRLGGRGFAGLAAVDAFAA